ncbi:MAG: hypothetical protein AB7O60_16865 [Variibacter sp.]
MADKSSLQWIGWLFGGLTFAVFLTAAAVVHYAIANSGGAQGSAPQAVDLSSATR